MTKQSIAVLTSGGDAPGMNAAIRAVIRKGIYHGFSVYGVLRGYQGLIGGEFIPLQLNSAAGIIHQGGTMLKTARSEAFKTPEGFNVAVRQLRDKGIDVLVVIGGDGSMAGAAKFAAEGIKTIVIPATIDNDMPGTDYTIGFDTAVNTILEAVNKIRDTAASHERVAVVEVMGRHSGQLALEAGLACGAEAVLIPEVPTNMDAVCQGLIQSHKRGKLYSIVIVAEGAGKAYAVAEEIRTRTPFSAHVTVLGYIQRGGSPSATDNIAASRMGALAVDCIVDGRYNCLIAQQQAGLVAIDYEQAWKIKRGIDLAEHELSRILGI
jgi:6-phosphofructokinase 1